MFVVVKILLRNECLLWLLVLLTLLWPGHQVHAADATPATDTSRSLSIAGTVWSGKDQDGELWTYEFKGDGSFLLSDDAGNSYQGTWQSKGYSAVAMDIRSGTLVMQGELVGDQLTGMAESSLGRWQWTASRQVDEDNAVPGNAVPPAEPAKEVPKITFKNDWGFKFEGVQTSVETEIHPTKSDYRLPGGRVYSPDGKTMADVSSSLTRDTIISDGERRLNLGRVNSVAFSPDGAKVAVIADEKNSIKIFDVSSGEEVASYRKYATAIGFSPDGQYLCNGEEIFDALSGKEVRKFKGEGSFVMSEAFTPDGKLLLVGRYKSGNIQVFEVATGRFLQELPLEENEVAFLAFSQDGSTLIAKGGRDSAYYAWNYSRTGLYGPPYAPMHEQMKKYNAFLAKHARVGAEVEKEKQAALASQVGALNAARGEFEKTVEYEARKRKAEEVTARIKQEYDEKLKLALARSDQEKREWQKLLSNTLFPVELDAELGVYDPDNETFSVKFFTQDVSVPVPRDVAVELKKQRVKIEGKVRYHDNETVELVNAYLVGESTKNHFAFGTQLEPVMVASSEKVPPQLVVSSISLVEPSGNGILDAAEKGRIKAVVRNTGRGTAFGVAAGFQPIKPLPAGVTLERQQYVGILKPGEEKVIEADITASEDVAATEVEVKAVVTESNGFDAKPVAIVFKSKELVPPRLQIAAVEIASADGKRVIAKGVQADILVRVQNGGEGTAKGVILGFMTNSPDIVKYSKDYFAIGDMAPGESKEATFSFAVNQRYKGGDQLPVYFRIKEDRARFSTTSDVKLALNAEAPELKVVKVEAKETPPLTVKAISDENLPPVLSATEKAYGENDLAVVVGIENYGNNLPKSEYSYNDAKSVKQYLEALGFARRNIEFLNDEKATRSAIATAVERKLSNAAKKDSRVLVYYSGHGAPEPATGDAYLVPYDGQPNYLSNTGYSLKDLYANLGKLDVKEVTVIIDACFSGAGGRSLIASNARPLVMMTDKLVLPNKVVVLSATQGGQISSSSSEKKHGIFTHFLLEAIRNGQKDLAGVYEYVKPRVEDEAKRQNVEQSPQLSAVGESLKGRFVLRN